MSTYSDHAQTIVTKLIDTITHGVGEWRAPWHHDGTHTFNPTNATTHQPYTGANFIALALDAIEHNHPTGTWATYRQWATLGAQVRKGESGTRCVRWITTKPRDTEHAADTGPDRDQTKAPKKLVPKLFTVFNAAQVDGWAPTGTNEPARIHQAETDIAATGATILHGGNRAFYRPASDIIQLPDRHSFTTPAGYYATALHELIHWTGHPSRLARDYADHGDQLTAYALEELTAELGAAMLTGRYGLTNQARPDHASYLNHWITALNQDPTVLFRIATKAQAAVDHILTTAGADSLEQTVAS